MLEKEVEDFFSNKSLVINRNLPTNFSEKDLDLFSHELQVLINVPSLLHFNKVIVFGNGDCYHFFSAKPCNTASSAIAHQKRRAWYAIAKDLLKTSLRRNTIELNRACWITDDWSGNYFHWFTDVIPKLIYLENKYPGYSILLPEKLMAVDFIKSSTGLFKLNFVTLISYKRVIVKDYMVIPNFSPTGNFLPGFIARTRNKFLAGERKGCKKIFVKRSAPLNRRVLNEQEISAILKTYSFDTIDLDEIKWKEQLELFSETKILIAVHGAALTNMLFMPEGAKVLELRRDDDRNNNCYFSLASAVGFDYFYQLCAVDDRSADTQRNNFYVCPSTFEKNIKLLLGSV